MSIRPWRTVTVEAASSLIADCPHSTPQWTANGVLVLRNTYLKNGRINLDSPSFTDKENYRQRIRRAIPQGGDLVVSREAPIGEVGLIPPGLQCCLGQRLVLVRPDPSICNSRFMLYQFIGGDLRRQMLLHEGTGSTVSNLRIPALKALTFELPPLAEQQAIAEVLGVLDDKIELNRRMNATLEELARTIFRSWFVDFDPVHAKAEGRAPFGMDADTAALFPDSFVSSELGDIPAGWRNEVLCGLTSYLTRGLSPKYCEEGGLVVLNQKCIRDGRVDYAKARRHDPSQKPVHGRLLEPWDVLVNSTGVGTLGRVAQLVQPQEATIVDSHITVVRANSELIDRVLLGVAMRVQEPAIEALGEGSTGQTELARARLGQIELVVPNQSVQQAFSRLVEPMLVKRSHNDHESRTLAELRDTLLPKLLSGEITVKAAERELVNAT